MSVSGENVEYMKIVYIIPGSGGTFYCQNCLRDNILASAMQKAGHEVVILPMYLPMFSDSDENKETKQIFFGAVNLYLKYRFPLLRYVPDWLMCTFDSPFLLNFAAKSAGSTKAAGLEGMTLDILNGETGTMAKELDKLVEFLSDIEKPDIIHISNALLLGIVNGIKNKLNVPVVCSLQDENQWVDTMNEPFIQQVWDLIAVKVAGVDAFVAVSKYYGDKMREKLKFPEEKLHIVHIGIDTAQYPERRERPQHRAIGFISKITESLGFGILAEAFLKLKKEGKFKDLKLFASGGITKDNRKFIKNWQKKIAKAGWGRDFIIEPEFDKLKRIELLQKLSLLSVPVPGGEAFGTYLLEAMAAGIPVVQPDEGGFSEVINKTGGGVVYSPNDADTLAENLAKLLDDPGKIKKLSEKGRTKVKKHFDISNFVNDTLDVYQSLTNA